MVTLQLARWQIDLILDTLDILIDHEQDDWPVAITSAYIKAHVEEKQP